MTLKNFEITETLYESSKTLIYKAIRVSDARPVIIKTRKHYEDEYLLKHEYEVLKQNRIEGVANVLNLVYGSDAAYLILEDKQGIVLDTFIKDKTLTQREFITIAKNAATALYSIHKQDIIHRDIKPANMLIDKSNLNIWFIDFGISINLNEEYKLPRDGLVGTIEFISPEQTGRVDFPVDFRSDLYSLGITLYYLLTKRMPFDMRSSMPLIHAQIAVMPPAPAEVLNVSPVLSDIVMKLIQKSPNDRYRTAESLEYDLSVCLNQLNRDRVLKKFPLATADSFTNIAADDHIMGKDTQLQTLKNTFSRVAGRRAEVIIIDGPAYSGKTGLTREFEAFVAKSGGISFRAVCDYNRKSEAFYAVNRALKQYYNQLLNNGVDLSGLKRALLYNLGENAAALVKIMPFLSELLGEQPELTPLSYAEEKRRDHYVFTTFLQIITLAPAPLILLIDNTQSADRQSLQLLISAFKDENLQNLMLVLSMRTNEIEKNPLLPETISQFEKTGARVTRITIDYLAMPDIKSYLDELFGENSRGTDELAEYILSVTGGRPLEVVSLINALGQKKLLKYNGDTQSFSWDLNEIKKMEFKLDAESKFAEIYSSLSESAIELLNYVSVYGSVYSDFSIDQNALRFKMKPLTDAHILTEHADGTYTFEDGLFRVYASNRMGADNRIRLHYEIGGKLYAEYRDTDKWKDYCETVTTHLNMSEELMQGENKRLMLARLNFEAGNICLSSSNATGAAVYYKKGLRDPQINLFETDYPLAVDMSINCALACLAKDNKEDFKSISTTLLENINNEDDKHRYYSVMMKQCISAGRFGEAVALGEKYLGGKGILFEEQPDHETAYKKLEDRFYKDLESKPIESFLHLGRSQDPEVLRVGNIVALLSDAMWPLRDDRTLYYHFFTCCYAAENGIFDDLETIFYNGALRLIKKMDYKAAEDTINIALRYADRYGGAKARVYIRYGAQISHWLYPIEKTFEIYKQARAQSIKEGLRLETNIADLMVIDARMFVSLNPHEALKEIDLSIQNASVSGSDVNIRILTGVLRQFIRCVTGRTSAPNSFQDANFQEDAFIEENAGEALVMYYYHTYKMMALTINGYFEQAMTHQKSLESLWDIQSGSILSLLNNFFYTAVLVQLAILNPASLYMAAAKLNQRMLKSWAEINPDNFMHYYLLTELMIACAGVDTEKVIRVYIQTQPVISAQKNRSLDAVMHEVAAAFWRRTGNKDYAAYHTLKAYELYKSLGFFVKMAALEPDVAGDTRFTTVADSISGSSTGGRLLSNKGLDLETVFNIVTLLNKDLDITVMSDKLLNCLIQNSGATRGFVVINEDNRPSVEAVFYSSAQAGNISTNLLPMPLSRADELTFPVKAMEYALNKKVSLSVNYATEKHLLFSDIYFKVNAPESFMCVPIMIKDKAIGAVYLENSALAGVFSQERVNMAASIINQTAAIFQNAIYYNELNSYAKTVETRLKEHSNLLNSMIAGIAHEINTPIGVCVTVISHISAITKKALQKFSEQKLSKAELTAYFDEISKGAHIADANITRAVGLVQNFKKVSANQSNEVFETINLLNTLNNIVEYIRPAVKKKVADIDVIGEENLSFVSCAGALTQIFTNLIMNSVLHGFENKSKDACRIKISFTHDKAYATIKYQDNGKGMTEEETAKLFQPFFTTKRDLGGSGLGAHIIYTHVTQTLNGQIYCKSEPGKGAEFIIKIPMQTNA